ncbi:MAG: 2-C-methyl-D-erythritol 4-phosphate cytidylyltransferase [Bacteroidetes bacterium]|nr:2-C-methyl-D-erythritol 4-phosphate cytidylyltransferase [Bacteroidota bacterium]
MVRRPKVYALIPAAGSGIRLGGSVKKQFLVLQNKPIVVHTLQRFEWSPDVDEVLVAVPEQHIVEMEKLIVEYRLHKVSKIIAGGKHRQDSVAHLLARVNAKESDIFLVHDGVRPFVSTKMIRDVIEACREYDAAVLAVQPKDTVRRSIGGGFFEQTLDRTALWLVQTPQAFRAPLLKKAYETATKEHFYGTDDAGLVERVGVKARIVQGSYDNIKITTQDDVDFAMLILERWKRESII